MSPEQIKLIEEKKEELAHKFSFADAITLFHMFLEKSAIEELGLNEYVSSKEDETDD